MLNPDGVRYGNYRTSLLGADLNRRWDNPSKIMHPTIYYTKKMIEVVQESYEIVLCCDMHGHSRK
jgi:murein tripeptide amidase MpaA